MPDPVWTMQYQMNQAPEGNGFTRSFEYTVPAVVNAITGGAPASRRVEIDASDPNSGVVFLTSTVPTLDASVGVTAETVLSVSGSPQGNAGVELTFLDYAVLLCVHTNKINFYSPGDGYNSVNADIPTASNSGDNTWRILFASNHAVTIYRNTELIYGPTIVPVVNMPFQRVLWWTENGVFAVWRAFRYYLGGAVAP